MDLEQLAPTAADMEQPTKSILAVDESSGTIKKRFAAIGVESTPDNRREYRELLFRSTDAMRNHITGVILYDETIQQNARDGTPLATLIEQAGRRNSQHQSGSRRQAAAVLPWRDDDRMPRLPARASHRVSWYWARLAKWRAVIDIGVGIPPWTAVKANDASRRILFTAGS